MAEGMRLFLEEKHSRFGIRASLENFGELQGVRIVPVYGVGINLQSYSCSFLR